MLIPKPQLNSVSLRLATRTLIKILTVDFSTFGPRPFSSRSSLQENWSQVECVLPAFQSFYHTRSQGPLSFSLEKEGRERTLGTRLSFYFSFLLFIRTCLIFCLLLYWVVQLTKFWYIKRDSCLLITLPIIKAKMQITIFLRNRVIFSVIFL